MTRRIKIGFILLSTVQAPIPSTRIAVLNMFPYLRAERFDPHVAFEPDQNTETPDVSGLAPKLKAQGFQIIYFQKVHGASVLALANELRTLGIKTVFGVCDLILPDMVEATDATVVVTDYLKSLYPPTLQPKMSVVHDGIEQPALHKAEWGQHSGSRKHPLRAVLVTSSDMDRLPVISIPPPWLQVTVVGRYPASADRFQRWREARWQFAKKNGWREQVDFLRFLTTPGIKRVAWDAEGVYQHMLQADVGIVPIETDPAKGASASWRVKSENRLTLMMALGLPVVATPIPAYEPIIKQGENGFLARDNAEWLSCLSALRDPALRQSMGKQARLAALAGYSMDLQAKRLIGVLQGLVD
jgi:hypothetical protein